MSVESYTTNYSFRKINFNSPVWSDDEHANWDLLDGLMAQAQFDTKFGVATGALNAYVLTNAVDPLTALTLVPGVAIRFVPNLTNTAACTLNVDGLGAKALWYRGTNVAVGQLMLGDVITVLYDGTRFIVVSPGPETDITAAITTISTVIAKRYAFCMSLLFG